jgi:hypothetical protein
VRPHGPSLQIAIRIFAAGRDLFASEMGTARFHLIRIGISNPEDTEGADLIDRRAAKAEHAVDSLRSKFGSNARASARRALTRAQGHGFTFFNSNEVISPLIVKSV